MAEENIVKKTCKELGLTYRELGERIGFGDGAIKNAGSSGKVSEQMEKAINLLIEVEALKKENRQFSQFKSLIKEISKG